MSAAPVPTALELSSVSVKYGGISACKDVSLKVEAGGIVTLIGANASAIHKAEDRDAFKQAMQRISLRVPESGTAHSRSEAVRVLERVGFPAIIRPSFTMGGTGGNIAYNREEFEKLIDWALAMSPVGQVLIELEPVE